MKHKKTSKYHWGNTEAYNGEIFTMEQVYSFMKKHMRLRDWLDYKAIIDCFQTAYYIFLGGARMDSKKENWKFYDDDVRIVWNDEEDF